MPPIDTQRHDGARDSPATSFGSAFQSFWMGGFEGADHINGAGAMLDMARSNGHAEQIEGDHRRAAEFGIRTVRETIGWRLSEPAPNCYDLARARRIATSARAHGLQVVWTLMHYGTPDDVSLLDDAIIDRFARFAAVVARTLGPLSARPPVYNPINEIGFVAWAVSETNLIHGYRGDPDDSGASTEASGYEVKLRLAAASLAAIDAVRRIDPRARFLQVEPLVHVVAPRGRPELQALAAQVDAYQWQVWDMLAGRIEPGLGGNAQALDLIGVNHYHSGQWEVQTEQRLSWHLRDARRRPLSLLIRNTFERYGRPMIVAETSHVGEGRAQWLHEVAGEVAICRDAGLPVEGLCLYPLVDRPDWNDPAHWHHSGLWDVPAPAETEPDRPLSRALCPDYAAALVAWQRHLPRPLQKGKPMTCLIVFSHLRWSFVYQRPQHLMSRLSRHFKVLFIEEPERTDDAPYIERIVRGPNLDVLVPHTPIAAAGFHDDQLATLSPMIDGYLAEHGIDDYLVWFYTPMALPLLASLKPRAVVYDCMDELTGFKDAPRQLRQRESALLKTAGLVFTGGPAIFESKRRLHPNVHCLPSAVDSAHFAPANLQPGSACDATASRMHRAIPQPRLGFFGVIDERLDVDLLAFTADAHPEWQLVMVGPVVKIDPASLPRRTNIHWLDMQPYELLPYLLAAWDVCLMPFALNEATQFISPTKTLEYMAGDKPIVSTPVPDVIALYGNCVRIAVAGPAFVTACENALAESPVEARLRSTLMKATVRRSSWDGSADTVHRLIGLALLDSALLRDNASPLSTAAAATPARSTAQARAAAESLNHLVWQGTPANSAPAVNTAAKS